MKPPDTNLSSKASTIARVFIGTIGLIFGGIGITVLAFLWGSSWGEFGSPPLFFRIFGSFIAIAFVVTGGTAIITVMMAGKAIATLKASQKADGNHDGATSVSCYTCPQCSAPLSDSADVSPHGDAKCTFCNCWFNVYGK